MSDVVDVNIFVRLIARDDPEKTSRCLALFKQAERGEAQLATTEAVVAEVVYVLASRSLYGMARSDIAARLGGAIITRGLRLDHKETVLRALALYGETKLDFVDCLCIAHAERDDVGIYSYDRGLDRISGVRRREP